MSKKNVDNCAKKDRLVKQSILCIVEPCTGCEVVGCDKENKCDGFVWVSLKQKRLSDAD